MEVVEAGRKAAGWAASKLPQLEDAQAARMAVLGLNQLVVDMERIRRKVGAIRELPDREDEQRAMDLLITRLGGITCGVRDIHLMAHRALSAKEFGKVAFLALYGADAGGRFFGLTDHLRTLWSKTLDSVRKSRPRKRGGDVPAGEVWKAVRKLWEERTDAGQKLGAKEAMQIFEAAGGNPKRTPGSFKTEFGERRRSWAKERAG